ncbi:hypothetical protein [Bacterioplanoides sp.]|uniref:hypothetical protein n=1 Tax=Bacterioplanoides sp. TaxID=2066072 RepID=UPI003B004757
MRNQLISDLHSMRAEAVKQLNAVDLFQPFARIQLRELEMRIKMIDYTLATHGWNPKKLLRKALANG